MRGAVTMRARGFTLVELLVSLLIGLFLLGGLLTLVQNNKRTFTTQNSLAQLQDGERLAMSVMTDVIQTAGYFPTPQSITAGQALPAATVNGTVWAKAQVVSGVDGAGATGDTVSVRYETNSGDGILSCNGTSNTSGADVLPGPITTRGIFSLRYWRSSFLLFLFIFFSRSSTSMKPSPG